MFQHLVKCCFINDFLILWCINKMLFSIESEYSKSIVFSMKIFENDEKWVWNIIFTLFYAVVMMSERKLSFKSMFLQLHFLLILQFWTVFLRIVQRFAWSFNIYCISVFWWFCSSYYMLECTLFNHQQFNNFFSFIACSWWFSYTSSFILLWSFHMISLKEWKSWWSSSVKL